MKKEDETPKSVSRRSILKGAAALGAIASMGGLALNMASPGTAEAVKKNSPKNGTRHGM